MIAFWLALMITIYLCFKIWNFTMKLFHLLGFTKELVFGLSASVTRLNLFFVYFLDGSHFFKVQLFSYYKLLFIVTEFAHLLRMFSSFYPRFLNLLIRSNDIPLVLTSINQEIFFDQSQFVSVVFLVFSIVFSCCLCILRNTAVFGFITCVRFCTEIIIA